MPLLKIFEDNGCSIGIWKINESIDYILELYPYTRNIYKDIIMYTSSKKRIKEILITKILVSQITNNDNIVIHHTKDGNPFLSNNQNISISHTIDHVAVIISHTKNVAIDIESHGNRAQKVSKKFILDNEYPHTEQDFTLYWSAKETIFKYVSINNLVMSNIKIYPFRINNKGVVYGIELINNTICKIKYINTPSFILTYIS